MSTTPPPVACRCPRIGERFRVHSGVERRAAAVLAYSPKTGEPYLVAESLWDATPGQVRACIRACINDRGERFMWCIPLGGSSFGGTPHPELSMADTAEGVWVTRRPACGSFVTSAPGTIPEPTWEGFDFLDDLHHAFAGRIVDSIDHPVLRELREDI